MASKFWNWATNDYSDERTLFLEGVIAEESWFEDDVSSASAMKCCSSRRRLIRFRIASLSLAGLSTTACWIS